MPYLLVRHKVEDYARWKPIFDADAATRRASGSQGGRLFHNASDPNELVLLFELADMEKARQYTQSEELRGKMQGAGVADQPDFYFLEEIEQLSR